MAASRLGVDREDAALMSDEFPEFFLGDTPEFHSKAACRPDRRPDGVSLNAWVNMFFPARGKTSKAARQICADCPVVVQCYVAGQGEKFGVRGDMAPTVRKTERRKGTRLRQWVRLDQGPVVQR